MINSDKRKLTLSGWLMRNHADAYQDPLQLQKFLFFYEAFCKVAGAPYDFSGLKGYERGPVFSAVWGDYTHNRQEFDKCAKAVIAEAPDVLLGETAEQASFLVRSLRQDELSDLTHQYNIWAAKSDRILSGEQQVVLDDVDFTEADCQLTNALISMYPSDMVRDCKIYSVGGKRFVFSEYDARRLSAGHMDTLAKLVGLPDLENPVFVTIEEDGVLTVD